MADDAWRIEIPHSHDSSRLGYGHLGTASYGEDRRWTFLRQPVHLPSAENEDASDSEQAEPTGTSYIPKLTHGPIVIVKSHGELDDELTSIASPPSLAKFNHISKYAPEVAFAAAEIQLQLTNKLFRGKSFTLNELSDPKLFTVGHITTSREYRSDGLKPLIPVVVRVSPHDPAQISVSLLQRQTISLEGEIANDYTVPSLSYDEIARLDISAEPILQLAFAVDTAHGLPGILVVRSESRTTILHPILHPDASSSGFFVKPHGQVEIPCTRTGGATHADVAINPADPDQIAIIDAHGNWSVWRVRSMQNSSARVSTRIQLLTHGSLESEFQGSKTETKLQYIDGWHKTSWLSDSVLLNCSRNFGVVCDMTSNAKSIIGLKVDPSKSGDAVLDIALVSTRAAECFILTTSYLIWMVMEDQPFRLRRVASWAHGRNKTDLSLRLHTLKHSEGVFVFISSTVGQLTVMQHALRQTTPAGLHYCLSDPLPLIPTPSSLASSSLHLRTVKWIQYESNHLSQTAPLFKAFLSDVRGIIHEAVYEMFGCQNSYYTFKHRHEILLPPILSNAHKSQTIVSEDDLDDFIVVDEALNWHASQIITRASTDDATDKRKIDLCDLRNTYSSAVQSEPSLSFNNVVTLQEALEEADERLETTDTLHLFMDLVIKRPYLAEIEDDSGRIDAWLDRTSAHTGDQSQLSIKRFGDKPLLEVYHDMLEGWISNLPIQVPDRTRVYKERLVRQVALEVFMSGITILNASSTVQQNVLQDDYQVDPAKLLSDDLRDLSGDLPASSQEHNILSLQKYTTFSQPLPSIPLNKISSSILAHIPTSIVADPVMYNYAETQSQLAAADAEATLLTMDARSRRRIATVAAARKRRLDRQDSIRLAASQQLVSVPGILTSSQIPIREIKSSQVRQAPPPGIAGGSSQPRVDLGSDMPEISLTQPERGVHGSRVQLRGKKKKGKEKAVRAPGFR